MTPLSQKCREKQSGIALNVGPQLSLLKPFQYKETYCIALKKNCPFTFLCIPNLKQSKVNKVVKFFCRLPEWIRNLQMIPGFTTRLG